MIPYSELPTDAGTGTIVQIGARKFIKTPFRWIAMSGTNEAETESAKDRLAEPPELGPFDFSVPADEDDRIKRQNAIGEDAANANRDH